MSVLSRAARAGFRLQNSGQVQIRAESRLDWLSRLILSLNSFALVGRRPRSAYIPRTIPWKLRRFITIRVLTARNAVHADQSEIIACTSGISTWPFRNLGAKSDSKKILIFQYVALIVKPITLINRNIQLLAARLPAGRGAQSGPAELRSGVEALVRAERGGRVWSASERPSQP